MEKKALPRSNLFRVMAARFHNNHQSDSKKFEMNDLGMPEFQYGANNILAGIKELLVRAMIKKYDIAARFMITKVHYVPVIESEENLKKKHTQKLKLYVCKV